MHADRPSPNPRATPRGPVDELVAQVLNGAPETLRERLEEACRQHPEQATVLRRRVEVLMDAGLVEPGRVELPDHLGEFRLLESIGEGGMGVVYRARQTSLERDVAVKLIRPSELRFASARERFAREVATIARLSHPGIVPVYAVGDEGGVPYFAMELVRGETLANLLALLPELERESEALRGADLDRALALALAEPPADEPAELFRGSWEQTALRIVSAVAAALEHAHASGILHRDVKPSNIMITRDGRVMLVDFGLSSMEGSDRLTRTGVQVGSFAYMAPELLTGSGTADRRSDVYSLGVTLYELLAGKLPYRAETLASLRSLVLQGHPRVLRRDLARGRRVSWEAETVCMVAMDVDRARRFASAGELARDLDNVLAGRPISVRRPGVVLRTRRFAARHPAWSASVLLLALAIPVTWAVQERNARIELGRAKAATDEANVALAASLAEVQRQEERADANFQLAREAVDRMLDRLGDVRLRDVPHLETLRSDVLKDALAFHAALVEAEPADAEQRLEYVRALRRTAEMHSLLSEFDEVSATLTRAQQTLDELIEAGGDERHFEELGQLAWRLVEAESYRGRLDEAVRAGRAARERLVARGVDSPRERLGLARLDLQLARALQRSGQVDEARETLAGSVENLRELRARGELRDNGPGLLATQLAALGEPQVYMVQGDRSPQELAESADYLTEALELRRAIAADDPTPDARFAVIEALNSLAGNHFTRGRFNDAIETYRSGRALVEQLVQDFPSVIAYQDARAALYLNLGSQYAALDRYEDALEPFTRAASAYAELHRARPEQRGLGVRRLIALQSLVDSRVRLERCGDELLTRLDEAVALLERLAQTETGQGALVLARLRPRLTLLRANVLTGLGRTDDALERARTLAAEAHPLALLQAATLWATCAAATNDEEERAERKRQAIDCVARALEAEPGDELIASWLGSTVLAPLRGEAEFASVLEFWGLEQWLER